MFFGLPGNPVSCLVTKALVVDPALKRVQGMASSGEYYDVDHIYYIIYIIYLYISCKVHGESSRSVIESMSGGITNTLVLFFFFYLYLV